MKCFRKGNLQLLRNFLVDKQQKNVKPRLIPRLSAFFQQDSFLLELGVTAKLDYSAALTK